jgi:hypothetical protein
MEREDQEKEGGDVVGKFEDDAGCCGFRGYRFFLPSKTDSL